MKLFRKKSKYQFQEPENTACFTCDHVVNGTHPILFVTHDSDDGGWQFLCGTENHDESNARILGLKEITEIDPTLNQLFEMPVGTFAERGLIGGDWKVFKQPE